MYNGVAYTNRITEPDLASSGLYSRAARSEARAALYDVSESVECLADCLWPQSRRRFRVSFRVTEKVHFGKALAACRALVTARRGETGALFRGVHGTFTASFSPPENSADAEDE